MPAAAEARLDARPRGLLADVDTTPFGGGEYGGGGCSDVIVYGNRMLMLQRRIFALDQLHILIFLQG